MGGHYMMNRKQFVGLGAMALGGVALGLNGGRAGAVEATNALEHQTLQMFDNWFAWIRNAGVVGYLGEHATPNSERGFEPAEVQRWLSLFDFVYRTLDENEDAVPFVTAHAATLTTFGKDGFRTYVPSDNSGTIADRTIGKGLEQAAVLEKHPASGATRMRGMNASSGNLTPTLFSAQDPGEYGVNYGYLGADDYAYLKSRGQNISRLGFRWERIQVRRSDRPDLNPALRQIEVDRIRQSLDAAQSVGMQVILDVHNYAEYIFSANFLSQNVGTIGSSKLPISAFAGLWRKIAEMAKDHPAVVGYDIMNEPREMTTTNPVGLWEKASQAAVNAIREVDADTRIWVPGYQKRNGFSNGLFCFIANHPRAWITGTNVGYTSHAYYGPGPGYNMTYDEAVAYWAGRGY